MPTVEETIAHIDERLVAQGKEITFENRMHYATCMFAHVSGFGTIGEIYQWRQAIENIKP